ncbi:kinase-like domain-containing protein [Mycena sanguinolenta]|nr:kinase-like domain-containing protein [Mycena sanguinolenta]
MSHSSTPDFVDALVDDGRLLFTQVLGSGNYGVVYKALDTSSLPDAPIHYAVKCLGSVRPDSPEGSRHDEREIKLHTLCSDNLHIATLHRRFCHAGFLFIVLELSAGGHLFDAIDTGVLKNNDTLVRDVFLQLIDAVRYCHDRGVYHRDLKPENILCSADANEIRIADFGLATDCGLPSTTAGGSVSYMSPESLTLGRESEAYEPRQSDIWALCIILLNMMSGLYPWRKAIDADAGFDAFLTDDEYLRGLFPISDPLNDLLERCFRPVPHARPTLLQLRSEIAAMDQLFANREEQQEARPVLLRPICYSAPPSVSTAPSSLFSSLAPSTDENTLISTLPSSASFDSSALRPTTSIISTAVSVAGRASALGSAKSTPLVLPSLSSSTPSAVQAPAPKCKRLFNRLFHWVKRSRRRATSKSIKPVRE